MGCWGCGDVGDAGSWGCGMWDVGCGMFAWVWDADLQNVDENLRVLVIKLITTNYCSNQVEKVTTAVKICLLT